MVIANAHDDQPQNKAINRNFRRSTISWKTNVPVVDANAYCFENTH